MALLDMQAKVPQIGPPRQSLVAIAGVVNETDDRFISGLTWMPEPLRTESNGDIGTWKVDASNTAVSGSAISPAASGNAYGIWAAEKFTAIGADWTEMRERVTRKLGTYESRAIEAQLWSDSLGVNPNTKLAGSGSALAGASGGQALIKGIGIADEAIASTWGRGMVHMRPQTLAAAAASYVLQKDGNVWVTPLGNIVVPGAGYSGLSPAGSGSVGDDFIYVTPPVEVHRSNIVITPDSIVEATNRATNDVVLYAMRLVATIWDYSAGAYYIRVTY